VLSMSFVDLSDVRIHYDFQQRPDAEVVVFCNSLGTNLSMWNPQMRAFREKFSVLRYDARGHGASSVTPYPYTVEQLSHDVLGVLDALGIERVHFCGLSLGGMVGQWLGVHASSRLKRLILCNTAPKIGTDATWNERIATVRRDGVAAIVPGTLERWYTTGFRREFPEEVANTGAMLAAIDPTGYIGGCAAVRDMDHRQENSRIQAPTMVVFGSHDPVTTPQDARLLLDSIKGAQPLELPAAHLSNIEAAAAFNAGVMRFLLDRQQPSPEAA
jgi:3-oxoadipate enol-lactonase